MIKELKKRQKQIRTRLWELLGDLPESKRVRPKIIGRETTEDYRLEKFEFRNGLGNHIPGYLMAPPQRLTKPAPAIVFFHAHGHNKDEILAGKYHGVPTRAPEFARRGYVVMVIDAYCFGERMVWPGQSLESEWALAKKFLWEGTTLWGMMIHDQMLTLDYLCRRPEVDPNRIGGMGFSMGSTMSWWMAALDDRIKVTVSVCCLSRYSSIARRLRRTHNHHGIYYYVPGILKEFDTEDIVTPIAPRPWLTIVGSKDRGSPMGGVYAIHRAITSTYRAFEAEEKFGKSIYNCDHEFLPEMWDETFAWFEKYL